MKIDVLTLFPEMYNGFKTESIIKRAIENDCNCSAKRPRWQR